MPSSSSTASSLAAVNLHLLLLTCAFSPLSSSSTLHHRRILHQPFLPQDSSPPSPPPTPSPPKYPFTSSTPDNSPFFQSYPSPPSPPSPASLATFPANISSLSVPRPSKPHSASNKLIIAAVAAVIAAVAVVSLSVFLHLRKRNSTHGSSSFCESKTQRSDNCSTISYNQTPNTHRIPKLQRPSQTSSEFLYIGTLVNTHAPGGGAAFNGSTTSATIYSNASNTRKLDSPELHPLPPLNIQQGLRQNFRNNAEVVSSKDDESEEFYSPKGSINGKESSIGTGTASRRAFAAIEVENFNGSSSNSSSTYSSSVPGSGSASPVRSLSSSLSPANNMSPINSIPKSPDLIEIQTTAPVAARTGSPPLVTQASLLHESASPSPPSSSPERYSRRSDESSPRISNASGQDAESPAGSNRKIQQNTTVFPTPPEILGLMLPQSAPMLLPGTPSPERRLGRNEDLSPRNSDVSDQHVESMFRISSHAQNNSTVVSVAEAPEMKPFVFPESTSSLPPISSSPDRSVRSEESSPRNSNVSDQSVECPVSPTRHDSTVNSTASEIQLSPISSTPERGLKSEESSPRNLNVLDQNMESPVRISSPAQHISNEIPISPEMQALASLESALPLLSPSGSSSPQRHSRENEELSPRISNASDHDVEPPVSRPVQQEMQDLVLLSPERKLRRSEELTPRVSDVSNENVASLVMFSSTELHKPPSPISSSLAEPRISDVPDEKVAPPMNISSTELHKSPSPISSSLPAPRMSNVSDENLASLRISSPEMHKPPLPISSLLPEKYLNGSEESSSRIMNDSEQIMESPERNCSSEQHNATSIPTGLSPPVYVPPPPPPPPPLSRAWPSPKTPTPIAKQPIVPPTLKNPLKPIAFYSPTFISPIQLPSNDSPTVKNDEGKESLDKGTEYTSENAESPPKPKLKPLHWDKVRASSDREMVWDQLKCSSFELNEEMIETLFVVNTSKPNPKETTKWQVLPSPGQDNGDRVLDPKKAQNIAILLKALHVTVDEVCEGLLEGNADILGTELLESLLKMAPTKEEEHKLKEYKDDSPIKLGAAERFLKAVVDVPHAFRRLEAMLYISNFESEVEYLKKSFTTLEAACEELRTSRMFLKLLEAVLKTGNRMNVGTNRGDAHAFKLDTLLKLVDVKGADGKTTLLHFVVQEIIRSEGARLSGEGPQEKNDDAKCRKLGLQVVSALSSELSNVKKAAVMDAEMLSTDVSKLSKGIANVREVIKLNEDDNTKFSDNIRSFIEKAEEEICRTQAQESLALSLVKEITEYFHGNSALEEAHPFRIFTVVKDFLTVLDRVCKEVGLINERTIVSSAHKFPVPVNPMLQQVPVAFHNQQCTSSDDESLPLNA